MKWLLFVIIAATLPSFNAWADDDDSLVPFRDGSSCKYGYINGSGKVVIVP